MELQQDILNIIKNLQAFDSDEEILRSEWEEYIKIIKKNFPIVSIEDKGDTISLGEISTGCKFCKSGKWDCSFITPQCNLSCNFCISPFNPQSNIPLSAFGKTPKEIIKNYKKVGIEGISISGGEPFCNFAETVKFFQILKKNLPDKYLWLYTNGTLIRKEQINALSDIGVNEIRFNTAATNYNNKKILEIIEYSALRIDNITIEIPVILKDKNKLISSLTDYSNSGVKFLNLHELMKEQNTQSKYLHDEEFKKYTLSDGHIAEISLNSRNILIDIFEKIISLKSDLGVNFCSTINKIRQIKNRRANIAKLVKKTSEKIVNDQFLESILVYFSQKEYQLIHPDNFKLNKYKDCNDTAYSIIGLVPLSLFDKTVYISVKKL